MSTIHEQCVEHQIDPRNIDLIGQFALPHTIVWCIPEDDSIRASADPNKYAAD